MLTGRETAMSAIVLDGPRKGPASGRRAKQLVVLLHGVGSDGNDLAGLMPAFAHALPDAAFAAPHAPFSSDLAGDTERTGRQWFSLNDLTPARVEAGAREAAVILDAFVAAEAARLSLMADSVALVGFSQGAMMALTCAFRRSPGPGAVLAYAGVLLGPDALARDLVWRPPVLLVHGTEDTTVPPGFSQAAEERLRGLAVPVRALFRRGMGHTIDDDSVGVGAAFLADWAEGKLVAAAPRPAAVT
jgi:phospholipase/carboxylesterase